MSLYTQTILADGSSGQDLPTIGREWSSAILQRYVPCTYSSPRSSLTGPISSSDAVSAKNASHLWLELVLRVYSKCRRIRKQFKTPSDDISLIHVAHENVRTVRMSIAEPRDKKKKKKSQLCFNSRHGSPRCCRSGMTRHTVYDILGPSCSPFRRSRMSGFGPAHTRPNPSGLISR